MEITTGPNALLAMNNCTSLVRLIAAHCHNGESAGSTPLLRFLNAAA